MAEDTLDFAIKQGVLPHRKCISARVALRAAAETFTPGMDPYLREYGKDAPSIEAIIAEDKRLGETIDVDLPYTFAQVIYAVREEMARTLEDVLSRRTRALLLDAKATIRAAPQVAAIMAQELQQGMEWEKAQVEAFIQLARADYLP
jgi:glycerol-3-phosphate dehydrogenase